MHHGNDPTLIDGTADRAAPAALLSVGDTLGQYKILGVLGRGAMGAVYAVRHEVLGIQYAIKLIHPEIAARADMKQRFRDEARVMARLRHPGIVQVDDFGENEGHTWLRMELVGGGSEKGKVGSEKGKGGSEKGKVGSEKGSSLADYLQVHGGKLPEAEVAAIVRQILEALAYAHAQGVVHRDLKPANILLSDRSDLSDPSDRLTVKIADFGLVSLAGDQWLRTQVQQTVARSMALGGAETMVQSATGMGSADKALLGTYAYMSPEQKRGDEVDQRSDLYSVGLMAFQMLTGENTLGMEPPSELNPKIHRSWDQWVRTSVATSLTRRYRSAGEMLSEMPIIGLAEQRQKAQRKAVEEVAPLPQQQPTAQPKRQQPPPPPPAPPAATVKRESTIPQPQQTSTRFTGGKVVPFILAVTLAAGAAYSLAENWPQSMQNSTSSDEEFVQYLFCFTLGGLLFGMVAAIFLKIWSPVLKFRHLFMVATGCGFAWGAGETIGWLSMWIGATSGASRWMLSCAIGWLICAMIFGSYCRAYVTGLDPFNPIKLAVGWSVAGLLTAYGSQLLDMHPFIAGTIGGALAAIWFNILVMKFKS